MIEADGWETVWPPFSEQADRQAEIKAALEAMFDKTSFKDLLRDVTTRFLNCHYGDFYSPNFMFYDPLIGAAVDMIAEIPFSLTDDSSGPAQ